MAGAIRRTFTQITTTAATLLQLRRADLYKNTSIFAKIVLKLSSALCQISPKRCYEQITTGEVIESLITLVFISLYADDRSTHLTLKC
ncbi:hypothetical protein Tcan_16873 [Toxocara canis]|uniref:Uncharacterized protein n=1 Tax=Toxocara canis TaxID=6265 RepID=A0A0B2V230_TOXCA|nr:hypothetical protein Tcan_16873 [Toxocara canis]